MLKCCRLLASLGELSYAQAKLRFVGPSGYWASPSYPMALRAIWATPRAKLRLAR